MIAMKLLQKLSKMNTSRITLVSEINKACYFGWELSKADRASYLADAVLRYPTLRGQRLEKYMQAVDNFIARTEAKF